MQADVSIEMWKCNLQSWPTLGNTSIPKKNNLWREIPKFQFSSEIVFSMLFSCFLVFASMLFYVLLYFSELFVIFVNFLKTLEILKIRFIKKHFSTTWDEL